MCLDTDEEDFIENYDFGIGFDNSLEKYFCFYKSDLYNFFYSFHYLPKFSVKQRDSTLIFFEHFSNNDYVIARVVPSTISLILEESERKVGLNVQVPEYYLKIASLEGIKELDVPGYSIEFEYLNDSCGAYSQEKLELPDIRKLPQNRFEERLINLVDDLFKKLFLKGFMKHSTHHSPYM